MIDRVCVALGKYHTPEEAAYAVNEIAWMTETTQKTIRQLHEHVQGIRQKTRG